MVDGKKLRALVDQYESYEAERRTAQEDQKQLLDDAEEQGFDKKVLRRFIKELRRDRAEVDAEEARLEEYRVAWLKFESTPLGAHAAAADPVAAE